MTEAIVIVGLSAPLWLISVLLCRIAEALERISSHAAAPPSVQPVEGK